MSYSQKWITKVLLARWLQRIQGWMLIFCIVEAVIGVIGKWEQKANMQHVCFWTALVAFFISTGCGFLVPFAIRGRLDWILFWRSSRDSIRFDENGVRALGMDE